MSQVKRTETGRYREKIIPRELHIRRQEERIAELERRGQPTLVRKGLPRAVEAQPVMAWSSNTKRGTREQIPKLRALAEEKGFEAVHALRSDGWHLVGSDGQKASGPKGTTFTIVEALTFLRSPAVSGSPKAPSRRGR